MNNPCSRCGKQRVDTTQRKSKMGESNVVYIASICPDKECQAIVDRGIAEKKEKAEKLIRKKEELKAEREKLVQASRA